MDKEEKKRLKRLGKSLAEEKSRRIEELVQQANPAPVGSDEWARNHLESLARERAARAIVDRAIPAEEAARDYIVNLKEEEFRGGVYPTVPGWFYRCSRCGD